MARYLKLSLHLLIASLGLTMHAQDAALNDRLTQAATLNALDTVDAQPWHAVIDLTLFDATGLNPIKGTVEIWQSGKDRRALYTFGNVTFTELVKDRTIYRTPEDPGFPHYAPFVIAKVLHPGPAVAQVQRQTPILQAVQPKSEDLDCIAFQPIGLSGNVAPSPDKLPNFCLDKENHLRATHNFQQTVLLDPPLEFLGHFVSKSLSISNTAVPAATANITTLEVFTPNADQFAGSSDLQVYTPRARISGAVIAGNILHAVPPEYPAEARAKHIGGTVVLHGIIGIDGHVKSLEVITPHNDLLAPAAMQAVKQWIYKPYLLNGVPTEVDTTITVNFNLN